MVSSTSLEVEAPAQCQMVWQSQRGATGCAESSGKDAPTMGAPSPSGSSSSGGNAGSAIVAMSAIEEVELMLPLTRSASAPGSLACHASPSSPGYHALAVLPMPTLPCRSRSSSGVATPESEPVFTPTPYNEDNALEYWPEVQHNSWDPWTSFSPMVPVLVPYVPVADGDVPPPEGALMDGMECMSLPMGDMTAAPAHPMGDMTVATTEELPKAPGLARKEIAKLRRKLREIAKIEERVEAGCHIDHFQQAKLESKPKFEAEVARAEAAKLEAETLGYELQHALNMPDAPPYDATYDGQECDFGFFGMDQMDMGWAPYPPDGAAEDLCTPGHLDPAEQSMYSMIEQAQLQAEMRAAQEQNRDDANPGAGSSRRHRRRGARGRVGLQQRFSPAEFTQALQGDDDTRAEALWALRGSIFRMSMESAGCRVVQIALEVAEVGVAAELVSELHSHVREAIESPHGNYVIQKVVEVLPASHTSFVVHELMGASAFYARHRYGCRIMCRLLEHSGAEPATCALMDEMLTEADDLCRHSFGHHVIQCVLEHSPPRQQQIIVGAISNNLPRHVWNRNASFVIEKVLTHCSAEEQHALLEQMVRSGPELLGSLSHGRLGPHIAKALSKLSSDTPYKMLSDLRLATGRSHGSRHHRRLLRDLGVNHAAMAQTVAASA